MCNPIEITSKLAMTGNGLIDTTYLLWFGGLFIVHYCFTHIILIGSLVDWNYSLQGVSKDKPIKVTK